MTSVLRTDVLGPNTRGVLHLLSHLDRLTAEQIDAVVAAWKRQTAEARAMAWAALRHNTTVEEQSAVGAAATLARHSAMAVAARSGRNDWVFWAAALDAAAGVAACGRVSEHHYHVLAAPMAYAVPWLAVGVPDLLDLDGLQAAIIQLGAGDG
jgi:hypothetical protein